MADITKIPTEELLKDHMDSINDAKTCIKLARPGLLNYGYLLKRAQDNKTMVLIIEGELRRRGVEFTPATW